MMRVGPALSCLLLASCMGIVPQPRHHHEIKMTELSNFEAGLSRKGLKLATRAVPMDSLPMDVDGEKLRVFVYKCKVGTKAELNSELYRPTLMGGGLNAGNSPVMFTEGSETINFWVLLDSTGLIFKGPAAKFRKTGERRIDEVGKWLKIYDRNY